MRLSQDLAKQRAKACTPEVAKQFYGVLKSKLIELGIIDKPTHIWNCDESNFGTTGRKRCFARKSDKSTQSLAQNNDKLAYTVLVSKNYLIIFSYVFGFHRFVRYNIKYLQN